MNARKIMACGAGALTAAICSSLPAYAQQQPQRPLSMTYQLLGIQVEPAKPAPARSDRCSTHTWVTSLGACGRNLAATDSVGGERAASDAEGQDAPVASAVPVRPAPRRVASDPAVPRSALAPAELPTLGSSAEPRATRVASGREAVLGTNGSADLLLRVGSKHRLRSNDESFTDANYQAHVQNNSHKALGVELLVPFQ